MDINKIGKNIWHDIFKSWQFISLTVGLSLLLVVSICFATLNIVVINTESGTTTLLTPETEPAKILDKAGIKLSVEHTYDVNSNGFFDEINVHSEEPSKLEAATESVSKPSNSHSATVYGTSQPTRVDISEPVASIPASQSQEQNSASSQTSKPSSQSSAPSSQAPAEKKELSDNANLSSIKVSSGKLSPSFKKTTYKYSVKVENSVKKFTVSATAADSKAEVKINGNGKLSVGENTIKVIVTAEDGKTTKTYRVTVTRAEAETSDKDSGSSDSSDKDKDEDKDKDDDKKDDPSDGSLTNYDFKPISELKAPKIKVDKDGQPIKYIEKYSGKCTAYYNPNGNLTASGRVFKPGHIAVNPKKIPYGTKLYVVSPTGSFVYGYCIAADTGGFVKNGSGTLVDLAFWTKKECNNFGRRTMNVYVLEY